MADKAVSELVAAQQITATDLFVLEQNGTAKKLTGQVLLNWLTAAADGHGGIASIEKHSTRGLVDTYRITLADTTYFDFVVTNGRAITSVEKTGTDGLVDTYTITFNDGSDSIFTVTNGAKGDKGDNTYTWIKYAAQEPTEDSHSIGNLPDDWIGIYYGSLDTAPDDWTQYSWFKMKGEQGETGAPATLVSSSVAYQVGDSGSIIPSGVWSDTVAVVPQGKYLWTRIVTQFNTGAPITSYSVSRMGIDGAGSVSSVAGVSPDSDGNVPLTAENIEALPTAGGDMTGPINMNGQALRGLNAPTADDQAVNKKYLDDTVKDAKYSSVLNLSTAENTISADMLGKTLMCRVSGNFVLTISKKVHDTLPIGFEFALVYWDDAQSVKISFTGGIYACIAGEGSIENATIALPERFTMIAAKKTTSESWLVTGNVEVV